LTAFPFESRRTTASGEGTGTGARMKAAVADKPAEAKEKISEFGRKAADQIDSQRDPVATTLDKIASAIHGQGETRQA
jgi:hypothetical protein